MPEYTAPSLDSVNFELESYSIPTLDAVDFELQSGTTDVAELSNLSLYTLESSEEAIQGDNASLTSFSFYTLTSSEKLVKTDSAVLTLLSLNTITAEVSAIGAESGVLSQISFESLVSSEIVIIYTSLFADVSVRPLLEGSPKTREKLNASLISVPKLRGDPNIKSDF